MKKISKHKKLYIRLLFGLIICVVVAFSIYGGIKWYKYNKTNTFYYEVCMGLKNGYDHQIVKAHMSKNRNSAEYFIQKRNLVTEENCKCVARWHSRTLNREYILGLIDRIQDNIEKIRGYDVLLDGMFSGNISKLETEVFVHFQQTEIHLKDCATIGFDGMVQQLEEMIKEHKSELDTVGVGHMYKAKSYNVLN